MERNCVSAGVGRSRAGEISQEARKSWKKISRSDITRPLRLGWAGRTLPSILDIVSCGLWQCVIAEENGPRQECYRELT